MLVKTTDVFFFPMSILNITAREGPRLYRLRSANVRNCGNNGSMALKLIPFYRLKPEKGIDYCRDHLRRKVKAREFPEPIALSNRRIAWRENEIDAWLASRPRSARDYG